MEKNVWQKETGRVGRGGSRGSAQVGACFILYFSVQTSGLFPQDGVDQAFSWTEGLGPGFEMDLSLLFGMGGSCTMLTALPTGCAFLEWKMA